MAILPVLINYLRVKCHVRAISLAMLNECQAVKSKNGKGDFDELLHVIIRSAHGNVHIIAELETRP